MMSDAYTIDCPHCKHRLHLPADFLGRVVSCLECKSPFRAPVKNGDGLTQPIPLAKSRGVPAKLFIPVAGLLMLGVAGLAVNGYFLSNPTAARQYQRNTLENLYVQYPPEAAEWKAADAKKPPDDAELKRRAGITNNFAREQNRKLDKLMDEIPASNTWRYYGVATAVLTLLGGLAFLLRKGYRLAFLGSFAAAISSPDLGCCFVGVIVAIWGFLALISEEGRRYFGRIDLTAHRT